MGTMNAPAKPEFRIVMTAAGRAITPAGARSKAKIFLLEDQRLILIHAEGSRPVRTEYEITSASFSNKNAVFHLAAGGTVSFTKAPCNCGMGVVAHAGITEDRREILVSVRPPEWVSGL